MTTTLRHRPLDTRPAIPAVVVCLLAPLALAPIARAEPLTPEGTRAVLVELDQRQTNGGDYKALIYLESKEADKDDLVYQLVAYRRDADDKLMMLFTKPKAEAGKGYLRLDKNLFMYDPATGKWDRRTERERIAGTDSSRADYDESRLALEWEPTYVGEETLGRYAVHHIALAAKAEADVAYPVMHIWVDQTTGNLLKAQERAASGRLMRTTLYPKWERMFSPSKGADVYFPREIRVFDEVETDRRTTIVIQQVDLSPLPDTMFSKAWLESQSR